MPQMNIIQSVNSALDIILEKGFLSRVRLASERLTNGLDKLVRHFPKVFCRIVDY